MRHFIKHVASLNPKAGFAVHVEGAAPNKHIEYISTFDSEGVKLFSSEGHVQRRRGFEDAGEGEVVGQNALAAHVREVEEGGSETTVVDAAGDKGSPRDDGARVGE